MEHVDHPAHEHPVTHQETRYVERLEPLFFVGLGANPSLRSGQLYCIELRRNIPKEALLS